MWFLFSHTAYCMYACVFIVCMVCVNCVCTRVYCYCLCIYLQGHWCAGVVWLAKTDLTYCIFLSLFLTLSLYYSMSTVAMETILLFLSSLLVCVAGKCPPTHKTHKHTSMHTNTHACTQQTFPIGRQCREWCYLKKHSVGLSSYQNTNYYFRASCLGFYRLASHWLCVWGLFIVYD